jgi:ribosomal protein S18 acetylase RimI-like enzyme
MDNLVEGLLIREIRIEDSEDILKIQGAITKEPAPIDFARIIEKQLQKDDVVSFIAAINGRVVGYMVSYLVYGGFGIEKGALIVSVGVDPEFMGKDIGKRLAKKTFEAYITMGVHYVYTSVRWDSVDLLSFFKTLGFDRSNFINLRKDLFF